MLLAIDVGNTNTVFALYDGDLWANGGFRRFASAPPRNMPRR